MTLKLLIYMYLFLYIIFQVFKLGIKLNQLYNYLIIYKYSISNKVNSICSMLIIKQVHEIL